MDTGKTSASAYYCRLYKGYWQGLIYQGQQNNPIEYSDKRKRKRNIARRLADRLNEYSEDFAVSSGTSVYPLITTKRNGMSDMPKSR